MKRIVLLAPAVQPPLTEGRKKFVVDLADTLREAGADVVLLNGAPARSTPGMIWDALRALRSALEDHTRVEAVVVFPFGRFSGPHGVVNRWFLRRAAELCQAAGVATARVVYSCAGIRIEQLSARFGPLLAVGRSAEAIVPMQLGIRHAAQRWQPHGDSLQRVLFLCGYQAPTKAALEGVLYERGLDDLLLAGDRVAAAGMRLTVAIPFLRDARMRSALHERAVRSCPALPIEWLDEVNAQAALLAHDAFVFPYRSEHAVFVPTSLLEALSLGIPVLAADHLMYRSLTTGASGTRCELHRAGDPQSLARAAQAMATGYAAAIERARASADEVRDEWTLPRAVDELLAAL